MTDDTRIRILRAAKEISMGQSFEGDITETIQSIRRIVNARDDALDDEVTADEVRYCIERGWIRVVKLSIGTGTNDRLFRDDEYGLLTPEGCRELSEALSRSRKQYGTPHHHE